MDDLVARSRYRWALLGRPCEEQEVLIDDVQDDVDVHEGKVFTRMDAPQLGDCLVRHNAVEISALIDGREVGNSPSTHGGCS
jgi:hypothetical protein